MIGVDGMENHREGNVNGVKRKSRLLGVTLALLLACGAFFSGLAVGEKGVVGVMDNGAASIFSLFAAPPAKPQEVDMTQFWQVWEILDQKFIATATTSVTTEERVRGAIDGLVRSYGDPYTIFMLPQETRALEDDISGNFSGVGMEIGIRNGVVTVIAPLPNTPAERAGILPGDVIIRIDERSTEGMRVDEAVRLIRGERGTEVRLSIFREGEMEIKELAIIRDNIVVPTIETERAGDVFIIRLYSFNALAEMRMQDALREYVRSGQRKLILDLRGNPGGLLQSSVSIAGFFLPTGKVVVREHYGEARPERLYRSSGRTLRQFAPREMVVLIDNGSASASEILAGALREHGLATLIGTTTFGKGSVQELVSLPDGSSLKITIARWLTPNGLSISEGGLSPDIVINRTPQQRLADEDPQLEAALRYLRGEEVKSETESVE
jgi:carboxyl-terminal processing protease